MVETHKFMDESLTPIMTSGSLNIPQGSNKVSVALKAGKEILKKKNKSPLILPQEHHSVHFCSPLYVSVRSRDF